MSKQWVRNVIDSAKKIRLSVVLLSVVFGLAACASSGPATRYYSLFADSSIESVEHSLGNISIGVGPVILPDYIEDPSVVSLTSGQQVRVSGYHAWAGNLKESMTRVLADDISGALKLDAVWGFPWDNRVRPDYQIRVVVEQFDGVRGGQVNLRAKWTLLNKSADKVLSVGSVSLSEASAGSGIDSYVSALNRLLNRLSMTIAEKLSDVI